MENQPRPIAQLGEFVLREIAAAIDNITAEEVQQLAQEMLLTLENSGGVGLAAPQIFESTRLIVVASRPTKRYPYAPEMTPTVMINPEYTPLDNRMEKDWEGCLSIPGIRAMVPRYSSICVTYSTLEGQRQEVDLQGFVARVFQHEYDHLNGLVFLDRVENNRDIISEQAFFKLIAA